MSVSTFRFMSSGFSVGEASPLSRACFSSLVRYIAEATFFIAVSFSTSKMGLFSTFSSEARFSLSPSRSWAAVGRKRSGVGGSTPPATA